MDGRSPAQVYSLVVGAILLAAGVAGFFYSAGFGRVTGSSARRCSASWT